MKMEVVMQVLKQHGIFIMAKMFLKNILNIWNMAIIRIGIRAWIMFQSWLYLKAIEQYIQAHLRAFFVLYRFQKV